MSYVLRVHVREAEPYTGLQDEEEVREAVREEVINTINDLGSDILEIGSDEERVLVAEQLTDTAMENLWCSPTVGENRTEHRLPGRSIDDYTRRRLGVLLSLQEEED